MLTSTIDKYLAIRRACDYSLVGDERKLRSFARFASERGETHVRRQTAIEWAALGASPLAREQRLRRVVIFAEHACVTDNAHEIPSRGLFSSEHTSRRIPYVFSRDELERLLAAALALGPPDLLRPRTFYTLYGLLACTGLRISEALALRIGDVSDDGLLIRKSKNRESRLLPLHDTSAVALGRYLEQRERVSATTDHLFVIEPKRRRHPVCHPVLYQVARTTFRTLVQSIGIEPELGSPVPRQHDLRHGYAICALETAPTGAGRVARHMLALSTYLGHKCITSTYWYLQVTPTLMEGIADACDPFVPGGGP
jgi:integrase/recombinase XerD